MNEGWIKLHRRFLEWEWFDNSDMIKLFVYFLLKANHKGKNWKGIKVERGQLITGRKKLAFELKMSEQKIRTCIERLKSTSEITTKPTNKYSIITVTNYDNYNIKNNTKQPTKQPDNNQPATNKQPTNNQQVTTNKNEENDKNEKKKEYLAIFNKARRLYPGTKRGNETEFEDFIKKHKDWKEVLSLLLPSIEKQIEYRKNISLNTFIPEWKHFKTWLYNRCWEEETSEIETKPQWVS